MYKMDSPHLNLIGTNIFAEGPARDNSVPELVLGKETRQVFDVAGRKHLGDSDHNTVQFKFVLDKGKDDEGSSVGVLSVDFSKAFDKVPHESLIKNVEAHGIEGNLA
eukprot:g46457.t1